MSDRLMKTMHVVAVSDTYLDDIWIFYPRMKYPPLAFSPVNLCKIDVFTSNILVLHHKMPQTVKKKVNRYPKHLFIDKFIQN